VDASISRADSREDTLMMMMMILADHCAPLIKDLMEEVIQKHFPVKERKPIPQFYSSLKNDWHAIVL